MAQFFDETRWKVVVQQADWYIQLFPELQALRTAWENEPNDAQADRMKREVRHFFADAMEHRQLSLGSSGPDLDIDRRPVDTVVVHHTSSPPGYELPYMNAVQLLNVYVPYFNNPTQPGERQLKGQPLWSNHVRDGQPVFYLYHWILRMDGSAERLLQDSELGWHAANYDINCRSVGICLDNDYAASDPDESVIERLAGFITEQYPQVSTARIFGHGEVSQKGTVCPGRNFVDGWKPQLIQTIKEANFRRLSSDSIKN